MKLLFTLVMLIVVSVASSISSKSGGRSPRRFEDVGGVPYDESPETLEHNTIMLSKALVSGETLIVSSCFFLYNGVRVYGLQDAVLQLDGELRFKRRHRELALNYTFDTTLHPPACFRLSHVSEYHDYIIIEIVRERLDSWWWTRMVGRAWYLLCTYS